jgi:hypothetical protein
MKRNYWILIIVVILIILFFMFFRFGGEDSWIKDSRGVWIKHGIPSKTPDYVLAQQEIINCALDKFNNFTGEINSQCLGVCNEEYAVDIVHVPRTEEDNLIENQCSDFREGKVSHFIELDKEGGVVRIV